MIMKKYFISILAAAVAFTSCINFEETLPQDVVKGGLSEIVFSDVNDDSFTATITAPAGTGYYSYVVIAGTSAPSAAKVFSVKCGTAVQCYVLDEEGNPKKDEEDEFILTAAEGTCRYCEGFETVVLKCTELSAATPYTVYVVAASEQGTPGDLAKASTVTTDNTIPVVKSSDKSEADSSAITIVFSDQITLAGDGTGAVAHFFGINALDDSGNLRELGKEEISKDSVTVSGNKLRLAATVKQPGLLTIFTLPAGFVKNTSGLLNEASPAAGAVSKEHGSISAFSDANGYVWAKNKAFDLIPYGFDKDGNFVSLLVDDEEADNPKTAPKVLADTTYMFNDWFDFEMNALSENAIVYENPKIDILYVQSNGRTVSYSTENYGIVLFGQNDVLRIFLDEAPEFGASVYYTIGAGSFEDAFGNPSNALTILTDKDEDGNFKYVPYFRSYGYELEDICGTYNISGVSAATGEPITETGIIIAPNTEPSKDMPYDLLVYNYGMTCPANEQLGQIVDLGPIGAWFDGDSGLFVLEEQIFGAAAEIDYYLAISGNSTEDYSMVWAMPEAGLLESTDYQLYELYTSAFKYYNYYEVLDIGAEMVKVSNDYSIPSGISKSRKVSRGCKVTIREGMYKF